MSNLRYRLKNKIVLDIQKDSTLSIRLCNFLNTDSLGLYRMMKRNSKVLMHIVIIKLISDRFNLDIDKIYEKY